METYRSIHGLLRASLTISWATSRESVSFHLPLRSVVVSGATLETFIPLQAPSNSVSDTTTNR